MITQNGLMIDFQTAYLKFIIKRVSNVFNIDTQIVNKKKKKKKKKIVFSLPR